ncbi:MAG: hypothetical protein GY866_36365 [Proteobacteria bacterium]|nr:hypothetical protein [Pseudomonadota bacterium]
MLTFKIELNGRLPIAFFFPYGIIGWVKLRQLGRKRKFEPASEPTG